MPINYVDVPRFVRPVDAPSAAQEEGFLIDVETDWGQKLAPGTCRFDEAFDRQCVIILGEPGIGKSTALARRAAGLGTAGSFFNLARTDARSVCDARAIQQWLSNEGDLHLVIDSLDEADATDRFPMRLVDTLRQGPRGRLRLELACRSAEWPSVLRDELPALFDEDQFAIYVMEPLRRSDAALVLKAAGVDQQTFLEAVNHRDLQALAARPLTLHLLIDVFVDEGELPEDASQIFEKGCLLLCDERSPTRRARQRAPYLEPRERIRVAQWIAAASVLAQRPVVVSADVANPRRNELGVDLVASASSGRSRREVTDTLNSGLFSALGVDRWGWVHQQLGEFLAARWMKEMLTSAQRRQLIAHPEDAGVIPQQLWGIASWLCCIDQDTAAWIAVTTPELLLASATAPTMVHADREKAVICFLARVRSREALQWWWQPYQLKRFKHPRIAEQLAEVFEEADQDELVRRIAIDVASACEATELADRLSQVALDAKARPDVRAAALAAACRLAPNETTLVQSMRALASSQDGTDVDEDVRAAAIEGLWPEHLTTAELLELLTPPRRDNFHGSYQALFSLLPGRFQPQDLVTALRWIHDRPPSAHRGEGPAIERLWETTLNRACHFLDDEAVLKELGRTAGFLLVNHRSVFDRTGEHDAVDLGTDSVSRRRIVKAIVEQCEVWDDGFRIVVPHVTVRLVQPDDIPWLLELYHREDGRIQERWADVVRNVLRMNQVETRHWSLVLETVGDARESSLLPMPRYVELGSSEAASMRGQFEQLVEMNRRQVRGPKPRPNALAAARATVGGELDAWWRLLVDLQSRAEYQKRADPMSILAWDKLPDAERDEIVEAARAYICKAHPEPEKWLHDVGKVFFPAHMGVLTINLLTDADLEWLTKHASSLAGRWAPAVIGFSTHDLFTEPQRNRFSTLVRWCTEQAPEQVVLALRALVRREAHQRHASLHVLGHVPFLPAIVDELMVTVSSPRTSLSAYEQAIAALLRLDRERSLKFARRALGFRSPRRQRIRRQRCRNVRPPWRYAVRRQPQLCEALLHAGVPGWSLMWEACRMRPWLTHHVADGALARSAGLVLAELPASMIGEIYEWLAENRPLAPKDVSLWDADRRFREQLLNTLVERSTENALAELTRLRLRFPSDTTVQFRLPEARRRCRSGTWTPPDVHHLAALAERTKRRLVSSDGQLMEAILDALAEYEAELQAETPAVMDLWNVRGRRKDKIYDPKDENDFSDHLKRNLGRLLRGVIVNREVEIRPTESEREGQRVDLLVQAFSEDLRCCTVVVEVKCCWNAELETAIQTQLVARYLSRGEFTHGIYLVGWFACADWREDDRRRSACGRRDGEVTRGTLESLAKAGSDDVKTVRVVFVDAGIHR